MTTPNILDYPMLNAFAPINPATDPPIKPPSTSPIMGLRSLKFTPYKAGSETPDTIAPIPADRECETFSVNNVLEGLLW